VTCALYCFVGCSDFCTRFPINFMLQFQKMTSLWSFTQSKNGRGGKGPLGIIYSNLPVEARSPTAGFEYLQRRRIHNPSGQPVTVPRHPQREEVAHFGLHLCFSLCPLSLILSLGTIEKSLAPSS